MTKQDLITQKYKYIYKTKCLKKCKNVCDLIPLIIDNGNINLQDLYSLDNCKSFKKR